nr:basic proline-rich protein-like [Populus alba]
MAGAAAPPPWRPVLGAVRAPLRPGPSRGRGFLQPRRPPAPPAWRASPGRWPASVPSPFSPARWARWGLPLGWPARCPPAPRACALPPARRLPPAPPAWARVPGRSVPPCRQRLVSAWRVWGSGRIAPPPRPILREAVAGPGARPVGCFLARALRSGAARRPRSPPPPRAPFSGHREPVSRPCAKAPAVGRVVGPVRRRVPRPPRLRLRRPRAPGLARSPRAGGRLVPSRPPFLGALGCLLVGRARLLRVRARPPPASPPPPPALLAGPRAPASRQPAGLPRSGVRPPARSSAPRPSAPSSPAAGLWGRPRAPWPARGAPLPRSASVFLAPQLSAGVAPPRWAAVPRPFLSFCLPFLALCWPLPWLFPFSQLPRRALFPPPAPSLSPRLGPPARPLAPPGHPPNPLPPSCFGGALARIATRRRVFCPGCKAGQQRNVALSPFLGKDCRPRYGLSPACLERASFRCPRLASEAAPVVFACRASWPPLWPPRVPLLLPFSLPPSRGRCDLPPGRRPPRFAPWRPASPHDTPPALLPAAGLCARARLGAPPASGHRCAPLPAVGRVGAASPRSGRPALCFAAACPLGRCPAPAWRAVPSFRPPRPVPRSPAVGRLGLLLRGCGAPALCFAPRVPTLGPPPRPRLARAVPLRPVPVPPLPPLGALGLLLRAARARPALCFARARAPPSAAPRAGPGLARRPLPAPVPVPAHPAVGALGLLLRGCGAWSPPSALPALVPPPRPPPRARPAPASPSPGPAPTPLGALGLLLRGVGVGPFPAALVPGAGRCARLSACRAVSGGGGRPPCPSQPLPAVGTRLGLLLPRSSARGPSPASSCPGAGRPPRAPGLALRSRRRPASGAPAARAPLPPLGALGGCFSAVSGCGALPRLPLVPRCWPPPAPPGLARRPGRGGLCLCSPRWRPGRRVWCGRPLGACAARCPRVGVPPSVASARAPVLARASPRSLRAVPAGGLASSSALRPLAPACLSLLLLPAACP